MIYHSLIKTDFVKKSFVTELLSHLGLSILIYQFLTEDFYVLMFQKHMLHGTLQTASDRGSGVETLKNFFDIGSVLFFYRVTVTFRFICIDISTAALRFSYYLPISGQG